MSTRTFPSTRKSSAKNRSRPATVQAIPPDMHSVTPHLVCAGASAAIDFYVRAFGARELARLPTPEGKLMHAAVKIGDSTVMLADEFPQMGSRGPLLLKGTPVTLHLYVEDVDKFVANAVKAGAKVVLPVQDMFWGDRYGQLEDPFGHRWSVATHVRDLSSAEIMEAAKNAPGC